MNGKHRVLTKHTCAPISHMQHGSDRIESKQIECLFFHIGSKTAEKPNCHLHSSRVHDSGISSKWSNPKFALKSNLLIFKADFFRRHTNFAVVEITCGYVVSTESNIDRAWFVDQFFLFLSSALSLSLPTSFPLIFY